MLCQDCSKRQYCSSLCPEAELYASQEEKPQREKTIGLPRYGKFPSRISNDFLTEFESSILTLLGQGLTKQQIAKALKMTMHSLRTHIYNIRKKS